MALNVEFDEQLVNAMIDAGAKGFKLGSKTITCVGIGRMQPMALAPVSGIIGIVGRVNGSILVNMSEAIALHVTSGMLMSDFPSINTEVLDGVAELTNVIGGRLKSTLATCGYPLDNITLPSVIVGQNYFVTQTRGTLTYAVTLSVEEDGIARASDRLVQIVLTLMTSDLKPVSQ
jgi:CheY-specific phosphatase CheX